MKKMIIIAAAFIFCIAAVAPGLFNKNYPVGSFDTIEAGGVYRIDLSKDARCGVTVQAPDYMEPYLNVKVVNGTLHLGMEKLPMDIQRKLNKETDKIWATVTMPSVRRISLSGAAKLNVFQPFAENGEFRLVMSGASHAEGLSIEAPEARIELSGAAKCQMGGTFGKLDLRCSGAAKMDAVRMNVPDVDMELSGASKLTMDGTFLKMDAAASGASKAVVSSETTLVELDVEASGVSRFMMENLPAENVKVDLSGTGFCQVNALKTIRIEASGVSTCQYKAGPETDVRILSAGRGSSVSRL